MAKSKETSVPLIFALVFFVLTTIAFGVMWYLEFSEREAHLNVKKTADKDVAAMRVQKDEAERLARVYRIYLGIPRGAPEDDVNTIDTESKGGDKIAAEVKLINDAVAKKVGVADANALPEEFKFWPVDASGKAGKAPSDGLVDVVAKIKGGEKAYQAATEAAKNYEKQIAVMVADAKALRDAVAKFKTETDKLPVEVQTAIAAVRTGFDKRTDQYVKAEAAANKTLTEVKEERDRYERELRKERDKVAQLQQDNQRLLVESAKSDRAANNFDEPQGKILRKLPDGVVEINLGSAVGVRPGLTFAVMPVDYPQKGPSSRMFDLRKPDGKGGFRTERSTEPMPKGAIEIYEVVNERLSLARVVAGTELDPIRDGIAQGDLLYNGAWRKGVADHIALVGLFDINGDGTDDIESVVRDLTKMGILVDAYYDMKKRAWVGQVTERTRYMVEGYFPLNSVNDPNRDEKTKLLAAMTAAINEGKQKGVNTINFRDFFGRMGYKFRLDVTDDKINQATIPYLSNVGIGTGVAPPPP